MSEQIINEWSFSQDKASGKPIKLFRMRKAWDQAAKVHPWAWNEITIGTTSPREGAYKVEDAPELVNKVKNAKDQVGINRVLESIRKADPLTQENTIADLKERTGINKGALIQQLKHLQAEKRYIAEQMSKSSDIGDVDDRFKDPALLDKIYEELSKQHKLDDREKMALFVVRATAELPNHRDHVSAALKGDSSSGKDNAIDTILHHFPSEEQIKLTRGTQAALENEGQSFKCIAFSEINAHREGGANSELTEIFKQLAEGGSETIKMDAATQYETARRTKTDQKTLLYGTTETQSDDELETRYVIIPIRGYPEKNKVVVDSVLDGVASYEKQIPDDESWIAQSIRALDNELYPIIPFAPLFKEKIPDEDGQEKYLFDLTKERVKRDVKRLMSLTKAITWLHQKQRTIVERDGIRYIHAEPSDFLTAIDLFAEFFNLTYSGLDHRLHKTYETIKQLEGAHQDDIIAFGYDTKYATWVLRHKLQEEIGIASVNTIKSRIDKLKDLLYVEAHYDSSIPKGYLVRARKQGINQGINRVSLPVSLIAIDTLLTGYLTPSILKEVYKDKEIKPIQASFLRGGRTSAKIDTLKIDTLNSEEKPSVKEVMKEWLKDHTDNNEQAFREQFGDDKTDQWLTDGVIFHSKPGTVRPL